MLSLDRGTAIGTAGAPPAALPLNAMGTIKAWL